MPVDDLKVRFCSLEHLGFKLAPVDHLIALLMANRNGPCLGRSWLARTPPFCVRVWLSLSLEGPARGCR